MLWYVSQMYALSACWSMIEGYSASMNIEYERVIRYRPDMVHQFDLSGGLFLDAIYTKL